MNFGPVDFKIILKIDYFQIETPFLMLPVKLQSNLKNTVVIQLLIDLQYFSGFHSSFWFSAQCWYQLTSTSGITRSFTPTWPKFQISVSIFSPNTSNDGFMWITMYFMLKCKKVYDFAKIKHDISRFLLKEAVTDQNVNLFFFTNIAVDFACF